MSAVVILATAIGCAIGAPARREALADGRGQAAVPMVEDDCPYRGLFVFWGMDPEAWPEGDRRITARVGKAFAHEMSKRGFRISRGDERFYWLTYNQASENVEAPGSFVWMAHTQALNDAEGRYHLGYSLSGKPLGKGVVGYYGLFQWTIADSENGAAEMADQTARALTPHMVTMCNDWSTGAYAEEERLERIRKELVDEIRRVRSERARQIQRRQLELEVEDSESDTMR